MVWARKADNPQLFRSIPQRGSYFVHNLYVDASTTPGNHQLQIATPRMLKYSRNSFISNPQDPFGHKQSVVLFFLYARVSS